MFAMGKLSLLPKLELSKDCKEMLTNIRYNYIVEKFEKFEKNFSPIKSSHSEERKID